MQSVTVEFESFPIKRFVTKASPATTLQSIIDQACEKFDINNIEVTSHKKDLLPNSTSIRFANLPPGAKLSLKFIGVGKSTLVQVALQTEEHGRLVATFPSNIRLWGILVYFEQKNGINLTRQSKGNYLMPVIVFMNKEYSSITLLREKSLRDLGLESGSGSLRLFLHAALNPIEFYLQEIEEATKESIDDINDVVSTPSATPKPIHTPAPTPAQVPITNEQKPTENPTIPNAQDQKIELVGNNIKLYRPPPDSMSAHKIELPPSFFEITSAELRMAFESQKSQAAYHENRPLMTQKMREREEKLKQEKYPKTMIRIRMPDRSIFEATFLSTQKVSELFDIVKSKLDKVGNFRLFITPPVQNLDPNQTFFKHGLSPASLVHFQSDSGEPWFAPEFLAEIQDYPVTATNETKMEVEEEQEQRSSQVRQQQPPEKKDKKFPKWFKPF
ncbi:Tether containing UBX domain for GLUT4 [Boothiomyces sp. JEL0838]|nr:Tether containing UBX domain for GLUT4 [Boothiomyces sp. JEL0838]